MPIRPSRVNIGKNAPCFWSPHGTWCSSPLGVWLVDVPFSGNPVGFMMGAGLGDLSQP